MGQQVTKEHGSPSGHGRTTSGPHRHHDGSGMPSSASFPGLSSSGSGALSALAPPSSPPPLPPHLADDVKIDRGGLVPQGVYTGPQDYDQHMVRQAVVDRRLAPFCHGSDDEDTYENEAHNSECPICFLYYPSPLNFSRCCHQPICTECFVQMKRADPNATNPPSSEARSCPFCVEPDFGVTYTSPAALQAQKASAARASSSPSSPSAAGSGSGTDSPNDAADAANFAERAIGTGGATASGKGTGKSKVLPVDDPRVITVDQVRPDWQAKLAQAQATIARRANRRVIMRQMGDRLIPIGISSSRAGADLAAAAEDGRINMNGPGGSIILQDRPAWGGVGTAAALGSIGSRRRGGRGSRSEGPNTELARMMRMSGVEDMEEMMLMEAMRLSLLDHEEQQKREADAAKKKREAEAAGPGSASAATEAAGSSAAAGAAGLPRQPSTLAQSPPTGGAGASSRMAVPQAAPARPLSQHQPVAVSAAGLGLSPTTMADLSELIEGGPLPPPASASAAAPAPGPRTSSNLGARARQDDLQSGHGDTSSPRGTIRTQPHAPAPAPEPVPVPPPVAPLEPAGAGSGTTTATTNGRPSIDKQDVRVSVAAGGSSQASPFGSPSVRERPLNPNNPFRKSVGEGS